MTQSKKKKLKRNGISNYNKSLSIYIIFLLFFCVFSNWSAVKEQPKTAKRKLHVCNIVEPKWTSIAYGWKVRGAKQRANGLDNQSVEGGMPTT